MADTTIAAVIAAAARAEDVLHTERQAGHEARFTNVDHLAGRIVAAALAGQRVTTITDGIRGTKNADTLTLTTLTPDDRHHLEQAFTLTNQQARGAWFLPEQASLKAGVLNQPAYHRTHPWHALTLAADDVARVQLTSTADAVAAWSLLIPLFDTLLAPITYRVTGSSASPDEQQKTWTATVASYDWLGLRDDPAVQIFGYRRGWARLDRAGQAQARIALLDLLTQDDPTAVAARFRARRIQALTAATLNKSRNGTPLARQVLTKAHQPVLAAYFGGDWLAFLDYLHLPPNPNEELVTALPEPRLRVEGAANISKVAAKHNLDADEVDAMLAAFMGQSHSTSPVIERVDVLTRWWATFDAIHARQTAGQPTLWGLVDQGITSTEDVNGPTTNLHRRLLPPDLVADIDRLWDGVTLPRWPDVIVSEPYPHRLMADTFGPAIDFWHGVALTAWYICEGPQSRTTISGLRDYHQRDLAAIEAAGTPIHPSLFSELQQAEQRLGPPQDLEAHPYELALPDGRIGFRFSGGGQRRDGFEHLRDIITRHRQGWTQAYLDTYLKHRWTDELTTVSRELHRHVAAKAKPPTFRQFAKIASTVANHWFNGDLAGLYTAIGEKAPKTPRRHDLLPGTADALVHTVYRALGGQYHNNDLRITNYPAANRFHQMSRLASASPRYVQITEALGRLPQANEFGANRYEWDWAEGIAQGWPRYQHAVHQALAAQTQR